MNNRLKEEVTSAGYSVKEVSEMTGIPERTLYSAFKSGHSFGTSILDAIAEHIDLDYNYIFTGVQTSAHTQSQSLHPSAEVGESPIEWNGEQINIEEDFIFVPHYNVSAEAGEGRLIEDVEPRPFPFRAYWIKNKIDSSPGDLMLIRVTGDSMYPTLREGDTVMVDRSKKYPASDNIYLVRIEDLYRIKRVQKIPGEKLRLTSDNQLYRDIEVDAKSGEFEIIGQIVWRSGIISGL